MIVSMDVVVVLVVDYFCYLSTMFADGNEHIF